MRALFILAVFAAAPTSAQTIIGPGDTFLLGGEQTAPLAVVGRNSGNVPVDVLVRTGALDTLLIRVESGAQFNQTIGARQIALFRNSSKTKSAVVDLKFDDTSFRLSMRYALPQK